MPEVRACGQEVHMDKIIRLQQAMPSDMEAAILQDAANRFFLTGMKSSAGTVLVTRNKAWLIIDFRYFEEAEEKVKNCRVIEEKNLYSQIKQLLEAEGISALSLSQEPEHGIFRAVYGPCVRHGSGACPA